MKLIDLLFPLKCPLCNKTVSKKEKSFPLCVKCQNLQGLEEYVNSGNTLECLPPDTQLFCVYKYNGILREAVIKYKFSGEIWMAKSFAAMIVKNMEKCGGFEGIDVITYVPVNDKRLAERGYDQTCEIAKEISDNKKIPLVRCLKKDDAFGDNASEKKDRYKRVTEKKYYFTGDVCEIYGKNVLLLDDILTTGSTLAECTRLLLEKGASSVKAAVLASGRKDIL